MKKRVAVIFGGEGYEKSISELSATEIIPLIKEKHEALCVGVTSRGEWYLYKGDIAKIKDGEWERDRENIPTFPVKLGDKSGFISESGLIAVDIALPLMHGDFGEDGTVQGALTLSHINYIGQNVYASAICQDKVYAKILAQSLEIPVARWTLSVNESLHIAKTRAEEKIGYPMFIKPVRLGSSYGAYPVGCSEEFDRAFCHASEISHGRVLIEERIDIAFELECAFLGLDRIMLCPMGIVKGEDSFYSFGEKYERPDSTRAQISHLPSTLSDKICEYARKIIELFDLRQLSRIDFFVTREGEIYFNEINTVPGMTRASLYPRLTEQMGLERGEFISLLIERATS